MKETVMIKIFYLIVCIFFLTCNNSKISEPITKETRPAKNSPSFKIALENPIQLKFNSGIRSILEDSQGNAWIASHGEGLGKYDGNSFTYYTPDNGLCCYQIRNIYEHKNGEVWFEGAHGLSFYDGEKILSPEIRNYDSKYVWKFNQDYLWFKNDAPTGHMPDEGGMGVYSYDGNTLAYHLFPNSHLKGNNHNGFSISTNFVDGADGTVWMGTYNSVIGYNGDSFQFITNESLGLSKDQAGLHVRALFEDSKGNLWIGNNSIGVLKQEGGKFFNFSEQHNLVTNNTLFKGLGTPLRRTLEHVFAIGEDKHGNMWFGDRDTGAWKFDGQTMKNYSFQDGLTTMHIWQIYNAKNGELWFAMGDGNILKFVEDRFVSVF